MAVNNICTTSGCCCNFTTTPICVVFTLRRLRQQTISIGCSSHMQFYPITIIDDNERCQTFDDVSRVTFIYWNDNNNSQPDRINQISRPSPSNLIDIVSFVKSPLPLYFEICRCEGVDSLMAYVHIDRKKEKIDSFCGEKPARPIMSNGPRLSLEFNGITSSRQSPGFKAVYTFTESE